MERKKFYLYMSGYFSFIPDFLQRAGLFVRRKKKVGKTCTSFHENVYVFPEKDVQVFPTAIPGL